MGMSAGGAGLPDVVTLGQLASFEITRGPMVIKSDNNMLVIYLPVEFEGMSLGTYVDGAQAKIREAVAAGRLEIPAGYTYRWSGQYEIMEKTNRRLLLIVPVTILIIVVVLFIHFRKLSLTLIVMGTLVFAAVGAIWLTYLLGYNISTAWWLGVILLLGLAAETGVIMLVYIENAYGELEKKHGRMTRKLLDQAIEEGATMRVRPKVMTVAVDVLGMAPMIWAVGAGAATLQRMAAPLVGGMFTSLLLTLVVIPAVYRIVKGWSLPKE
jgi:Cu(I)/Ag(I) efflux system membrane protein CusA/SilA